MIICKEQFEVCCRYDEKNHPFIITAFKGRKDKWCLYQWIIYTFRSAMLDHSYGISSQCKSCNKSPQIIPKVSNPNNTYQFDKLKNPFSHAAKSPRIRCWPCRPLGKFILCCIRILRARGCCHTRIAEVPLGQDKLIKYSGWAFGGIELR